MFNVFVKFKSCCAIQANVYKIKTCQLKKYLLGIFAWKQFISLEIAASVMCCTFDPLNWKNALILFGMTKSSWKNDMIRPPPCKTKLFMNYCITIRTDHTNKSEQAKYFFCCFFYVV